MPDRNRKLKENTANTTKQLNRIYARDLGMCQLCGLPCSREDASRDHIKELKYCTKAEARDDNNMQLAHKKCNLDREYASRIQPLTFKPFDILSKLLPEEYT